MPFVGSAALGKQRATHARQVAWRSFSASPRKMNQTAICFGRLLSEGPEESLAATEIPVLLDLLEEGQARYARDTAAGRVDTGVSGCRRRSSLWVVKEGRETYQ